jgi:hypothetical protein
VQEEQTCLAEWREVQAKMEGAQLSEAFVASFKHSYDAFVSGDSGTIAESAIDPVGAESIPTIESVRSASGFAPDPALLDKLVILKLNGGLGTSMGLERAKSLLQVREGTTFLDLIAQQVLELRKVHKREVRFMLMNSFSTSDDTKELLGRSYPTLASDPAIEVVQNKAPKIEVKTHMPATWEANPNLEWCPPGHGDLYVSAHAPTLGNASCCSDRRCSLISLGIVIKTLRWPGGRRPLAGVACSANWSRMATATCLSPTLTTSVQTSTWISSRTSENLTCRS